MSKKNQSTRRKRGVVLSVQGWQRLQAARHKSEVEENGGKTYTLEELSELTNLSPNTLTKVQRRQTTVDQQTLECYFSTFNLALSKSDYTKLEPDLVLHHHRLSIIGQVPINSPFYIERSPDESLCYEVILQPGSLIRLKAPRQMGKTSLMARILNVAREHQLETVALSLQLADAKVLSDLNLFLRWFCATITRDLGLANKLPDYWDDIFGGNYNCTDYFERYLLKEINSPLVLGLDQLDTVFNYPEIATDFFGLLRSWHEKAKYGSSNSNIWQNLRLVVVHSTEVYLPPNSDLSLFNFGLLVEFPEFTKTQVQELAQRYQLNWNDKQVDLLMSFVGGNPYLVQLSLYQVKSEHITFDQLLVTSTSEEGIYSNYLCNLLWKLKQYPELATAMKQVVNSHSSSELEPVQAFKLQSMGLVKISNQQVRPSCGLYRQYFSRVLTIP
ncbi:MAG: AAA-like domain-containing protein [Coleofasciculaceae cyanobacterium]